MQIKCLLSLLQNAGAIFVCENGKRDGSKVLSKRILRVNEFFNLFVKDFEVETKKFFQSLLLNCMSFMACSLYFSFESSPIGAAA